MQDSFYKIVGERGVGCKIFFTDRRMDKFRSQIHAIFGMMDAVDGSNVPEAMNIKRKVDDCSHKAMAVRYNLALIEREISNRPSIDDMKNYSEMIAHNMCNQAELKNDVLIYETEAFLFQVRTSLDILIQLLKYVPDHGYLEDKNKKGDNESFAFSNTTNNMRANGHTEIANFLDAQVTEWIMELNKMRNEIAHRSGLKGFASFVFDSGSESVIHPHMPNGMKVDEYCEDIFDKLMLLYKKVFQEFVLPKII